MKNSFFIDMGNSRIKIARVQNKKVDLVATVPLQDKNTIFGLPILDNATEIFISSVVGLPEEEFFPTLPLFQIDVESVPANKIDYLTKHTLGVDRVLAAFGAFSISNSASVIVDSGSATTIDVINNEGCFLGGIIAPGLEGVHKGMKVKAPKLPEVSNDIPTNFPGKTTVECLQWGMNAFFIDGISTAISRSAKLFDEVETFILGGNADLFRPIFPNAHFNNQLLFLGMRECENKGWFKRINPQS